MPHLGGTDETPDWLKEDDSSEKAEEVESLPAGEAG